jgi:hypothetical protein
MTIEHTATGTKLTAQPCAKRTFPERQASPLAMSNGAEHLTRIGVEELTTL